MYNIDAIKADHLRWEKEQEDYPRTKTMRDVTKAIQMYLSGESDSSDRPMTQEQILILHQSLEFMATVSPTVEVKVFRLACLAYLDSFKEEPAKEGN